MNNNQRDTLASCLTQVFGRIEESLVDAAVPMLDWIELAGGETLFEEGNIDNGVYFVISGRLRASVNEESGPRALGEMARGETIGEMAFISGEPRSATVTAIRDTVLAHASREVFEELVRRHPELTLHMARLIMSRLKKSERGRRPKQPATICLLAISDGVDLRSIGERLVTALDRWGVSTHESSARIDDRLGKDVGTTTQQDSEAYGKVTLWLDDVEFWNEFVVLAADEGDTEWTRRCLRHADEILLLARAEAPPRVHELEERFCRSEQAITGARQTLVLLYDEDQPAHPSGTEAWLDRRPVDAHLHIRPSLGRDFERLARIVSGNAIGLVLGGGGARGFSQLGVYKALEESGIAIDLVAGTSIGAVMAAWISFDRPAVELIDLARQAFAKDPTGDLNFLPMHSLIKGQRLKKTIRRAVIDAVGSDADMSDSWRTLSCVATNFSRASESVIQRGHMATSLLASVSIPVALPPVLRNGDLLIDGGVFNNYPIDVVADMGARRIIGVDLGRAKTRSYDFDEIPSTWKLLLDRLRGRRRRYKLPTLGAMMMGTTILYSESRRNEAQEMTDIYLNPDLRGIGLLEWKALDRLVDRGYRHTKELLSSMSEEDLAPYRDL